MTAATTRRLARWIPLAVIAAAAGVSIAALSQKETNTLTAIDTVPSKTELDNAFAGSDQVATQANLVVLAQDPTTDPGVRLRAIHALASYCLQTTNTQCDATDPARLALQQLVTDNSGQNAGAGLLILRAAVEALGQLQVADDVTYLEPLLNHPSRDIQAATAHALGVLCNTSTSVIDALRARYAAPDTTAQVKLAISEALRILSQSPGACSVN